MTSAVALLGHALGYSPASSRIAPRFGLRKCIGNLPSEGIAKGIRSCGVVKAESKVKSLGHLPASAAVDGGAASIAADTRGLNRKARLAGSVENDSLRT